MKYLLIGDPHIADRAPSSRVTYRDDILAKLEWCVHKANELEVDALISLGDTIHIKRPDRTSHALIQEASDILGESKAPVLLEVGNHDLTNNRLDSLPSQPLGTLALHPNIDIIMGGHPEFPLFAVPYFEETEENLSYWVEKYHSDGGPDKFPLLLMHASIFPRKEAPIFDYFAAETIAEAFKAPHLAYGHIHSQMKAGAHYEIGGTWFCNEGSLSRGSLTEHHITRDITVALYDDSRKGNPFTSISVPHKPASEVFKLEVVELQKQRQNTVDAFLDSLGSAELQYLTVEGILEEAKNNANLPPIAVTELEDIIINVVTKE